MIGWEDISKVIVAMVPLYFALTLGYASVKWWRLFKSEESDVVNRLFCYLILPFFSFDFISHSNPFQWNYKFIAADFISKLIIVSAIAIWAKLSSKGNYRWSITTYSLTLSNTLVIGVPLLKAMYGPIGVQLTILSSIIQCLVWFIILMFVLEWYRADESAEGESLWSLMKVVCRRVGVNPNSYGCVLGFVWALIASRWDLQLPSFIHKSVMIMSNAGSGTAMFSMGMFMALQPKVIACGARLTLFGMMLKFIAAPVAMAIAAIVLGLRGDVLRIVIIQAALPQSITCFIYAREYGLHANVLSTAVIFGTVMSLPIMIAYYAVLESSSWYRYTSRSNHL